MRRKGNVPTCWLSAQSAKHQDETEVSKERESGLYAKRNKEMQQQRRAIDDKCRGKEREVLHEWEKMTADASYIG